MNSGKVVTFYSYKGGTGRSMALANVAWILAANGKRVLVVDWDLEAPGLHRYFLPFLSDYELNETPGLIDLLWAYLELAATPAEKRPIGAEAPLVLADPLRNATPLEFPFSTKNPGCIHLLGAGRQARDYGDKVRDFDWSSFYESFGGGSFFDLFRKRMKEQYDYILIDSRTGVSDTAGICTLQMPDMVVLCFTYNRQSIKGVEAVADTIMNRGSDRSIDILPIPMRVVKGEHGHGDARNYAREVLGKYLPTKWPQQKIDAFWGNNEIQHYPVYSFQEILAALKENPFERSTLLADFCWITGELTEGYVTEMVSIDEAIRHRYLRRFELRDPRLSQLKELMEDDSEEKTKAILSLGEAAIKEVPADAEWLGSLASAFVTRSLMIMNKGRMQEALSAIQLGVRIGEKLFDIAPSKGLAHVDGAIKFYVYILTSQNRLEEAISQLYRLSASYRSLPMGEPNISEGLAGTLVYQGGVLSTSARQKAGKDQDRLFSEAVSKYAEAVCFKPDMHEAFFNWGSDLGDWAGQKTGEEQDRLFAEAVSKYAEAVRINPDMHQAFCNWGNALGAWAQQKTGEEQDRLFSEAFSRLMEAEQLNKGVGAYNLACLSALTGKHRDAVEWLLSAQQSGTLPDIQHVRSDEDLISIRGTKEFKNIVGEP